MEPNVGAAVGLVRDALAWIDDAGRIVWCNPAFETMVGADPPSVFGAPLSEMLHLLRDGQPVSGDEHPARRVFLEADIDGVYEAILGGRHGVVEVFGRRGMIEHESAAVLVVHDITEAARASAELEQLNAKLEATNAELEAFSYSVSHDLRTPLRAIDGFSQALLEDYADVLKDEGKNYLVRIRAAAQAMGRLIDDLLRLSRVTRTELAWTDVDLSAMCRSIATELATSTPTRQVAVVIPDGLVVRGDERLLRQTMQNLLGNAWKFTTNTPHAQIEVGAMPSSVPGAPVYFVHDNGAGFDMARAEKLFGAFQRLHTSEEFPGTGIGLAIARRIVHRHGGRIWAEAERGKGATFYFTLPSDQGSS